jgi:heme-degrading monooxygenase HmoA
MLMISEREGFVSLTVWSSADDGRVIVQGRWRSAVDFRAESPRIPKPQRVVKP